MSQLVPFCMPNDNRETGSFRRSVSLFPLSKGDNNEKGKRPLVVMGRRFIYIGFYKSGPSLLSM